MFSRLTGGRHNSETPEGDRNDQFSTPLESPNSAIFRTTPPSRPAASTSGPSSSSPRNGSPRRTREWVPLFVSPPMNGTGSTGNSPLITATVLPPTPRRTVHGDAGRRGDDFSPSRNTAMVDELHQDDWQVNGLSISDQTSAAASSGRKISSKDLDGTSPTILQQRKNFSHTDSNDDVTASSGTDIGGHHLRKRSNSNQVKKSADQAVDDLSMTKMERLPSLTSMMDGNSSHTDSRAKKSIKVYSSTTRSNDGLFSRSRATAVPAGTPTPSGVRPFRAVQRLVTLIVCVAFSIYMVRQMLRIFYPKNNSEHDVSWLSSLPRSPISLYDTLETVPYPMKTHPRTPRDNEYRSTSFADYLSTRLGSHFSYATTPRKTRPSHLWLTTATNTSVRISAPHLNGFVNELDRKGEEATIENLEGDDVDHFARRTLVTLCRDAGCIEYCRSNKELFCWGGMIPEGRDERKVKLRAIVETLESGRRLFFIDDDVFFKLDPVPYMGALSDYDMQITDTWKTGGMQTGFLFANPTQNVISLFDRLLGLSRGPDAEDHIWRTTNLLLDPIGAHRDHSHVAPPHLPGEDENLFIESTQASDDAIESLYGQVEFESPWGGGIDVRVLDRRRFRTSTGRLAKMDWERERNNLAVYFHCNCCGDLASESYMAGALGYHTPSVVYPALESDIRKFKPARTKKGTAKDRLSPMPLPSFPLVLRFSSLVGNASTLQFIMGMMLQTAHDSNRTLVPPLKGTLLKSSARARAEEELEIDRYVWRIFPTSDWSTHAHSVPGGEVSLTEPNYVAHAIEYLRATRSETEEGIRAISELSDTLWLDFKRMRSYEEMIRILTRPYYSHTRVVNVEFVEEIEGKEFWELRTEFQGLDMCEIDESQEGHGGEEGTCDQICPIRRSGVI